MSVFEKLEALNITLPELTPPRAAESGQNWRGQLAEK